MVSTVYSGGIMGIDGFTVNVECSINSGLNSFDTVGLPDAAVKESKERVISAIESSGFDFPLGKITVNLAPGNVKKEGSGFDLPIAMAILVASARIRLPDISEYLFIGELSLKGDIRPVSGVLPMVINAWQSGFKKVVVAKENAAEASVVRDIEVFGAENIHRVIAHLTGDAPIERYIPDEKLLSGQTAVYKYDFADVKGQENVKRGLEIAAAGGHNCLMIGTPGSGKTMLAQRLPSILPDLSFAEALEVTKIHSIAGTLPPDVPFINTRPFRSPHHTVSTTSITGGGRVPRPGEVSLAHHGVLFLDELPEFKKSALEVLRQPLEDKEVSIARVSASITYPCNFMMIAAMNPCPCGYFGDKKHQCGCSTAQIHKYLSKISGPLVDRIDLHIQVSPVEYSHLTEETKTESSAEIKKRVNRARQIQLERYRDIGIYNNANLDSKYLNEFCKLGETEKSIMELAFTRLSLSARAYSRIIKVARTIADLAGEENISAEHILEAVQYRSLDKKYLIG